MARGRSDMRKIKEIIRLIYECGNSQRRAARSCGIGRATVQEYLLRFKAAGITWDVAREMGEEDLERLLFPPVAHDGSFKRTVIDFEYIWREIRRPDMTLALLWEEYKTQYADGYQYSQFCELFRHYSKTVTVSMRQEHKAGEKGFVDFGTGLSFIDMATGELIKTQLFVFVWGASNYTFAKAVRGEDLISWITVNADALEYFGCAPKAIVPDNLKSAVVKACRYEPGINPTYTEFADHYGLTIFPARPRKPKDKAKVEVGVKLAKRWILARLRNAVFTSIEQMNEAIAGLVEVFNFKQMKRLRKSRRELFELLDKPNALALPSSRYEYAEWKKVRVNINYHVMFDEHDYSVPYTLIHQELEVRATARTVEIYKKGVRICSHCRSFQRFGYTTVTGHMPPSHQKYLEWTPERILEWGAKYGSAVRELIEHILSARRFPEQAYRSCLGVIRLANHYPAQRLNAACGRALLFRSYSYQSVKKILARGLDEQTPRQSVLTKHITHENIRGADYFKTTLS